VFTDVAETSDGGLFWEGLEKEINNDVTIESCLWDTRGARRPQTRPPPTPTPGKQIMHDWQEGKRQAAQDLPRKAAQDLPHQAAQDLPRQQRFPVAWIRRGHSQTHGHHLVPKFESLNLEVEVDLDALFLIYFFICA